MVLIDSISEARIPPPPAPPSQGGERNVGPASRHSSAWDQSMRGPCSRFAIRSRTIVGMAVPPILQFNGGCHQTRSRGRSSLGANGQAIPSEARQHKRTSRCRRHGTLSTVSCRGGSFSENRPSPTGPRRGRRDRGCWPCRRLDGLTRLGARRLRSAAEGQAAAPTGGESFPPLPLPATPLRRSEKKRPPTPPALVGKMAMGPTRWVTKDGKRVQYRDWMTDPADVDSLLAWTEREAGHQLPAPRPTSPTSRSIPANCRPCCLPATTSSS